MSNSRIPADSESTKEDAGGTRVGITMTQQHRRRGRQNSDNVVGTTGDTADKTGNKSGKTSKEANTTDKAAATADDAYTRTDTGIDTTGGAAAIDTDPDIAERPLVDITAVPSAASYLRDAWQRREFAIVTPAHDLRAQNMDTVLGQLWHLINPAMLVGVYFLIFGVLLDTSRGVDNFLGFLLIGVVLFHLIQRVAQDAAMCITRNLGLIRSIQFPRILLPVSTVNGQTVAFLPALALTLIAVIATGEKPALRWLVLLPVLAALFLFNIGVALLLARMGRAVRDLPNLLPHLLRLLLYSSGVIFHVDTFVTSEAWRRVFAINPVYDVITCARWCLLGMPAAPWTVAGLITWSTVLPILAFTAFRRYERRFSA